MRALVSDSSLAAAIMIPSRRVRSPGCARTVSGHTTAEPAMALMKSRRLIAYPEDNNGTGKLLCLGRGRACPLWVKSRHLRCKKLGPLYPRKRTHAAQQRMSALARALLWPVTGGHHFTRGFVICGRVPACYSSCMAHDVTRSRAGKSKL